jgi:hypothetical protein
MDRRNFHFLYNYRFRHAHARAHVAWWRDSDVVESWPARLVGE